MAYCLFRIAAIAQGVYARSLQVLRFTIGVFKWLLATDERSACLQCTPVLVPGCLSLNLMSNLEWYCWFFNREMLVQYMPVSMDLQFLNWPGLVGNMPNCTLLACSRLFRCLDQIVLTCNALAMEGDYFLPIFHALLLCFSNLKSSKLGFFFKTRIAT